MSTPKDLHVSQTGESWEDEDSSQTLAQAETKEEAIDAAHDAGSERKAEKIVVHTADGRIEVEIPVRRAEEE
jgi:Uncharacterized protein conserved in bacteria (DUF2188)